jgi:hypothetical protein
VKHRGPAIIEARGASSAASASAATIDHTRDCLRGSADGDWLSMAVGGEPVHAVAEPFHPVLAKDAAPARGDLRQLARHRLLRPTEMSSTPSSCARTMIPVR